MKRVAPNGPENANAPKSLTAIVVSAIRLGAQSVFLLAYFTILPVLMVMILHWGFHAVADASFYTASWMAPTLLISGTFLGGALIGRRVERETGGLRMFVLGVLALLLFAGLTQQDIRRGGEISSRLLPMAHDPSLHAYAFLLPAVGILGILAYRHFSVK